MKAQENRLLNLFATLAPGDRDTLLAFAEFLAARERKHPVAAGASAPVPAPEFIERPEHESIVAGLKRLSRTYPMLDKSEMLSATSDLVATHIMQGTDAGEVIDRLEEIFAAHYRQLKAGRGDE